jgi:hypothetical protein
MDPEKTLRLASEALKKGKRSSGMTAMRAFNDVGDHLSDYWRWRQNGGFEPKNGDARAEEIAEQVSDAWEEIADEDYAQRWVSEAGYDENPTMQTVANRGRGRRGNMARRDSNKACATGELAVKRRGYKRKDGTSVAATTYCAQDQGKPGRTAYGAKGGTHSRAKGHEPWIQEKGSLGEGFLTTMSFAEQKSAMKRVLTKEKKEHRGDHKAGYKSALGKNQALEQHAASAQIRREASEDPRVVRG